MPALRWNGGHNDRHAHTALPRLLSSNADTGVGTQTRTATLTVNPPSLQVTPSTNILPLLDLRAALGAAKSGDHVAADVSAQNVGDAGKG